MAHKLFHDSQGNVSSKRVFGGIVVVAGVISGFWGGITGNNSIIDYAKWAVGFGTLLLEVGVFEQLKK